MRVTRTVRIERGEERWVSEERREKRCEWRESNGAIAMD